MPISPTEHERPLDAVRNAVPAFMLDFLSAWGFRVVGIAFRAGVFTALRDGARKPEDVAQAVGFDPEGTAFLLDALDTLGYVVESDGEYANAPITRQLMPMLDGGIAYFERIAFKNWEGLEDRLRGNTEVLSQTPRWLSGDWRVFNGGQLALARMNIDEVVRHVELPRSARHLLDLGGGHGLYSVAFCRKHPQLTATIIDVPAMRKLTDETIAGHDMADRVRFQAGDFATDDLGTASVVLVFNVIHSKNEQQNRELLARAAEAVEPGGQVVLLDQFASPEMGGVGRAFGSLMALSMFNVVGQRTYRLEQVREWFVEQGLTQVRAVPIRSAPGNALVLGTKPRRAAR